MLHIGLINGYDFNHTCLIEGKIYGSFDLASAMDAPLFVSFSNKLNLEMS